jgi:hypothetical protein
MRPLELKTLDLFCKHFLTNIPELAGFMAEDGFLDKVVDCRTPWVRDLASVIEVVSRNAKDNTRKDQSWWIVAYLKIAGHPAAGALERILPEG